MSKEKIAGLRTTIYHVGDLESAKKWYADAFEVQPYFDQPFYVGFNVDGYELGLQPEDATGKEKRLSVVAYWAVNDVASQYNRLLTLGAKPVEEPTEVGEGIVVATVADPWGNAIGLIFNPHFG